MPTNENKCCCVPGPCSFCPSGVYPLKCYDIQFDGVNMVDGDCLMIGENGCHTYDFNYYSDYYHRGARLSKTGAFGGSDATTTVYNPVENPAYCNNFSDTTQNVGLGFFRKILQSPPYTSYYPGTGIILIDSGIPIPPTSGSNYMYENTNYCSTRIIESARSYLRTDMIGYSSGLSFFGSGTDAPYGGVYLLCSMVIPSIFGYIPASGGGRSFYIGYGEYPIFAGEKIFASPDCLPSGNDVLVINNALTSSTGNFITDIYGTRLPHQCTPAEPAPVLGYGGIATIKSTSLPCFGCYCYSKWTSYYSSETELWSTPHYEGNFIRKQAQTTTGSWYRNEDFCSAEYYLQMSNEFYIDCDSEDAVCDIYDEPPTPTGPSVLLNCDGCPTHCALCDESGKLCCCNQYMVRVRIYNDSLTFETFYDVLTTREGTAEVVSCRWIGSSGPVNVEITCYASFWQITIGDSDFSFVPAAYYSHDTEVAHAMCPGEVTDWGPVTQTIGNKKIDLISVGCNCPTNCSNCNDSLGLLFKEASSNFYKGILLTKSGTSCNYVTSSVTDASYTATLKPNNTLSAYGQCYWDLVIQLTSASHCKWTYRAVANSYCVTSLPLVSFSLVPAETTCAGGLLLNSLVPITTCDSSSTGAISCPHDLDFVLSDTGSRDFIATLTRSGNAYFWSYFDAGRQVAVECFSWYRSVTVQFLSGLTYIGRYQSIRLNVDGRETCPGLDAVVWTPIINTFLDGTIPNITVTGAS